jgi:branched-chain amino acid transport system ATP-binding protein
VSATAQQAPPVLEVEQVTAGYGPVTVLRDVSFTVQPGEVVALLGPNGAGKTTTLSVIAGLVPLGTGTVRLLGEDVTRMPAHRRSARGLCLIPEGRGIFPSLTVAENLRLQTPPSTRVDDATERALTVFPLLRTRMGEAAGRLSGGQQQMLALARTCTTEPRLILVDEASMGLAPLVVDEIFEALGQLSRSGVAMVVVEQYVSRALAMADTVVLMLRGRLERLGPASELNEQEIGERYLSSQRSSPT